MADPRIVSVDETGLLIPVGEGKTGIRIRVEGTTALVPVEVRGLNRPEPVSFEHQIIPLLTKAGCNAGACHGKAEGQNGFKLSVFGFNPSLDYDAMVKEGGGRRVFPMAAETSLVVRKATADLPHAGGRRIQQGTPQQKRLIRWIREGCPRGADPGDTIVALEVEPAENVLTFRGTQQLRVTAVTARGSRKCVSAEADYDSNAPTIAAVDRRGWVQASDIPGEAAILVRYMGTRHGLLASRSHALVFASAVRPRRTSSIGTSGTSSNGSASPRANEPTTRRSSAASSSTPSARCRRPPRRRPSSRASDPKKRSRLVDALLERPEYADYWAMNWSDLLRVDRDAITPQGPSP